MLLEESEPLRFLYKFFDRLTPSCSEDFAVFCTHHPPSNESEEF